MTAILEDAQEIAIDKWGTLNTAASPQRLPDGHSPNNQNVWMDEKPGSVVTANGYSKLGQLPSGNPATFLINFFRTSDGSSQLVCSDGVTIYWTTNYVDFTTITTGLSEFFQLRGLVIRDKLWLTNGSDEVMTWDGTTLTTLDGTAGTPNVPKGKYIAYHDERVWMFGIDGDLSAARFSALANTSGTEIAPDTADAWPADNEIQISEGDADVGTGIFLYRGYLYCSKQYSIWRITGYDEYTYTRVKTRASTGTRFQESIQIVDNLVHFIGVDGLYVFDGEEAKRISDIIDPASPDEGVFAFRNLQQTLLNNQFWNVSETADFVAGTVPRNLVTTNDRLTLDADDSQADFNSGTKTRVTADDNPGNLQLSLVASGNPGTLISSGDTGYLEVSGGVFVIGSATSITDADLVTECGFEYHNVTTMIWRIDLGASQSLGRVIIRALRALDPVFNTGSSALITSGVIQTSDDNSSWTTRGTFISSPVSGPFSATNYTIDFATIAARYVRVLLTDTRGRILLTEVEVYKAGYEADGKFISATIDYGVAPASFGALAATITTNSQTYQFFTQSSADGSSWDAEVNLANGAAITSTLRRYLRWGVYLYSSTGISTAVIDKVYVGGTYISEIHDTGGNIYQWGAFQLALNKAGQTINAYFRAAATSGGVAGASWIAIVPGAIPNTATTNVFIQIRLELSTTDATQEPYAESFTVNWILSNGTGINTLQNVASFVWLNRYWLAAATLGATENDIVIVRGKSTFGSPWHKKDFKLLSFCRFQDYFIAGSSEDGSIYRLEIGYSKNGSVMDSFYETADYSKAGFILKGRELLVTTDRSGPYDLSIGWSTDGGLTYTEKTLDLTRASGASLSFTTRLNISFMSHSVRFRVRINGADKPFSVDDIRCYYRLSPQRGSIN